VAQAPDAPRLAAIRLHAIVVTGDDGRVAGILSALDVVAWVAGLRG
jgi:CBS-domain-containing membrane protein